MEIIHEIWNFIKGLSAEQIALISIFVTFVIYLLGKNNEIRLKKHELKKEPYIKLIKSFERMYFNQYQKNKDGTFYLTDKDKQEWFDMGSSLLIYGSKKLYKTFVFYRTYDSNLLLANSKYKDEKIALFLFAQLLIQIRKEIGLNSLEGNLYYDSLAFFVNDIFNNPVTKINYFECRYRVAMLKLELFFIERFKCVYVKKFFYYCIKPILGILQLILKYFIMLPIGKILIKLFPKFTAK